MKNKVQVGTYTPEELINEMNAFETVSELAIDEDLVTDYIMIGGYTTEEAYLAAEAVARYDNLF
tara:strand:- start:171 stop:362 length:192 start_codon:yes stop_codon:yes gene_type:complete